MWLFPVLSILTALGIVAILVQMFIDKALRWQLVLSLLSWAVVIVLFAVNKWFVKKRPQEPVETPTGAAHRVLVLANQTLDSRELLEELSRIGADRDAQYLVVVPASPVDTGRRPPTVHATSPRPPRRRHRPGSTPHSRRCAAKPGCTR